MPQMGNIPGFISGILGRPNSSSNPLAPLVDIIETTAESLSHKYTAQQESEIKFNDSRNKVACEYRLI